MASVTLAFLSFSLSSIRGITLSRYFTKVSIMAFAISSKQFAATMTQFMLASFAMQEASERVSSENSAASLILGVAISNVWRSSSASLRSFHFEDFRLVWKEGGNLVAISTTSAVSRASGGASTARMRSSVGTKRVTRRTFQLLDRFIGLLVCNGFACLSTSKSVWFQGLVSFPIFL